MEKLRAVLVLEGNQCKANRRRAGEWVRQLMD